jgi:hypothetical protein
VVAWFKLLEQFVRNQPAERGTPFPLVCRVHADNASILPGAKMPGRAAWRVEQQRKTVRLENLTDEVVTISQVDLDRFQLAIAQPILIVIGRDFTDGFLSAKLVVLTPLLRAFERREEVCGACVTVGLQLVEVAVFPRSGNLEGRKLATLGRRTAHNRFRHESTAFFLQAVSETPSPWNRKLDRAVAVDPYHRYAAQGIRILGWATARAVGNV